MKEKTEQKISYVFVHNMDYKILQVLAIQIFPIFRKLTGSFFMPQSNICMARFLWPGPFLFLHGLIFGVFGFFLYLILKYSMVRQLHMQPLVKHACLVSKI